VNSTIAIIAMIAEHIEILRSTYEVVDWVAHGGPVMIDVDMLVSSLVLKRNFEKRNNE
jgi:hypothetical protein